MKLKNANELRREWVDYLMGIFAEKGEDVGEIASNSFNFPVVKDGEEGWVEIVVKVPKDESDDGYLKRTSYELDLKEKEEKAKAKAEAKAKKIAYDKRMREKKAKAKAEAEGKG